VKEGELGRVYSEGEIIFREGDEGDRMYVVQSGAVRITKKTVSGELTIATLNSGEIFGEMAVFGKMPRSATAVAAGEARILTIDKRKLLQTISRDPTIVFKMLESMSHRIRKLDEEFAKLKKSRFDSLRIFVDVDEMCKFILEETRHFINADNGAVMLCDEKGKRLLMKASFGSDLEPDVNLRIGEMIAGDVMKTGEAELINDVSLDARFTSGMQQIRSVLCVPLKWKETGYGVIHISRSSDDLFTLENLKVLRSVGIYASIAIENAVNAGRLRDAADALLKHATLLDLW
jgi:putative methionine-R-sulfoxide reductase with GAF domain